MPARSIRDAAAFVRRVGVALVYPKDDSVLPSLWEAVAGNAPMRWAVRDDAGKFEEFTPEFQRLWRFKDELPSKRLACVGMHVRGNSSAISPEMLPALYSLTERSGAAEDFRDAELSPLETEIAELVLAEGPCTAPAIREALAVDKKRVDKAVKALHRMLVLTNAGVDERGPGWPAVKVDVLARRYGDRLRSLPSADEARASLALAVLRSAGEVSAPDLSGALGWTRKTAAAVLGTLTETGRARRDTDPTGFLWRPRGGKRRSAGVG